MRQLYVTAGGMEPELLGVLSEVTPASNEDPFHSDGTYMFKYTIGGKFHKPWMKISKLDNPEGVYVGDSVFHSILRQVLPSGNFKPFLAEALKQFGMPEYDEWEWLRNHCHGSTSRLIQIFETLPENTVAFQEIPKLIND